MRMVSGIGTTEIMVKKGNKWKKSIKSCRKR